MKLADLLIRVVGSAPLWDVIVSYYDNENEFFN